MGNRVLVLDASHASGSALGALLVQCGLAVDTADDIDRAADRLRADQPACVLVRVEEAAGAELCRRLRPLVSAPIVVVCPERDEELTVRCLEAGADRVWLASMSRRELAARLGALLARESGARALDPPSEVLHVGDLAIDLGAHSVTQAGRPIALTPTEFRLLAALARRAGDVVSRTELLSEVWGAASPEIGERLRLYVCYLRQKLGDGPGPPSLLLSRRGSGYQLALEATAGAGTGSARGGD